PWISCLIAAADACAPAPAPVRDISLPRFYGDADGSTVDPERDAAHKAAVAGLTAFVREITQSADKALRNAKPERRQELARCALEGLSSWARGGAYLGTMATRQAEYQRKWDLAGLAVAYLKLKPFSRPEQRAAIEPWLREFADRARAFFDDRERQRNNHWYWLGLAVAAVGVAAESPRHWDMARDIMRDAARDIGTDGTLPKEMVRKSRALHYHAFALTPLVVMAELAANRGEDWYALEAGALHRLANLTIDGLARPDVFDSLASTAQERPVNGRAGWLQLYRARFPDRVTTSIDIPDGHRWIGGSATILAGILRRP
ncbi:MAG TPA: alginate lyase family protein, partial [Hyphomicrobiaceae bacterium]|nr:alginate lyase family protein [Hyphomicrobiaceae bacterium]